MLPLELLIKGAIAGLAISAPDRETRPSRMRP
jgi:hypothetical protein